MRKRWKTLILTLFVMSCFTVTVNAAQKISINDLINNTTAYDMQTVTVEGEAIGEALERGDHAWVNINDGSNAIGIWMTAAETNTIKTYGDYKHVGDTLRVTGVFSRSCAEHGGDVDIHCSSIEIIKSGYDVKLKTSNAEIIVAAILLFAAASLSYFYYKVFRRKKA